VSTEIGKAVALAEKPKAWLATHGGETRAFLLIEPTESGGWREITPLFTRQQVIAELAQRSGKMPEEHELRGVPRPVCWASEVREAIAAMQAQIDLTQAELAKWIDRANEYYKELEQANNTVFGCTRLNPKTDEKA